MSFDALTLAAVVDEVRPLLEGGRIQRLAFPRETDLALEVYTPQHRAQVVLLSADPERARVARIGALPARGVDVDTPFLLLARKHLRAARIRHVHQPPYERVLQFTLEQRTDDGEHYNLALIVEVMGRRSNLLLVDTNGVILDAARRTPASRNPRRPILPHLAYQPPPPQERHEPGTVSAASLADAARGHGGRLDAFLTGYLAGISPQSGRELAFRATGSASATTGDADWVHVMAAFTAFYAPLAGGQWSPSVALDDSAQVAAYAPYELRHLAAAGLTVRAEASISAAVEQGTRATGSVRVRGDALAADRKQLLARLGSLEATLHRREQALAQQLSEASDVEQWREAGELILTYQSRITPGASELQVEGRAIPLDPSLSPSDNAQAAFARYRKRRDARARVPAMLEEARHGLEYVQQLQALTQRADSPDAVRALRREVQALARPDQSPAPRAGKQRPARTPAQPPFRRLTLGQGFEALVGSSAEGNAHVTFELARPDDLWLHIRGRPGPHVILRSESGRPPTEEMVQRIAGLAAWYSTGLDDSAVEIDVAPRRQVRKIPGGPPGLVRYEGERTLRVRPRSAEQAAFPVAERKRTSG